MLKEVNLYTDGACFGNPGPGAWAFILRYQDKEKELSKGYTLTTNNRMELMAALKGLSCLKQACRVLLYSDSQYLCKAINEGWLKSWSAKGWRNAKKEEVKNKDLWLKLLPLLEQHQVTFIWVQGHSGHIENERCDTLAKKAAQSANLVQDTGFADSFKKSNK